ncbi:MAG: gamma-glutamylcyclotransferase [Pseudomonadota bacterium]
MDPFAHHPELRPLIADPSQSFLRDLTIAKLETLMLERGLPGGWWHSDETREALRAAFLASLPPAVAAGDLWIFAYGSLMWDPALMFAEVRRARVEGYARHFILKDTAGGRGTLDNPGLMAALDRGAGCDGLAFRIPRPLVERETEVLWRRELVGPAYRAMLLDAVLDDGTVTALSFVADHEAPQIDPDITRAEQLRCLVHGTGFLGTSLDYLRKIAAKVAALGIRDAEIADLLAEAEAMIAAAPTADPADAGGKG